MMHGAYNGKFTNDTSKNDSAATTLIWLWKTSSVFTVRYMLQPKRYNIYHIIYLYVTQLNYTYKYNERYADICCPVRSEMIPADR